MNFEFGLPKDELRSEANYAPWHCDARFKECRSKVVEHGAVDMLRHYELWRLALQMGPIPGDLLEVGVWKGSTGMLLAMAAKENLGGRAVHLCDTFRGIVKAGPNDPRYKGGSFQTRV
jgi:O-methyltransferase